MKYYLGKMKLLLMATFIIFIGLIFTWYKLFGDMRSEQNYGPGYQTTESITPTQKSKADLTIDYGGGKTISYVNIELNESDTAYSLLVKKMNETGSPIKTRSYDLGLMVESINNITASSAYFWSYSVNGQTGNVAADKYILKDGDKIEWKFTKIQK